MKQKFLSFALFTVLLGLYVSQSSPSVTAGDSGEFMTAAATLSIPHAPSYPLYTVTCRSFLTFIPWGSVALRCNYFSAFTGALAVTLLFVLLMMLQPSLIVGMFMSLMLAFSRSFWENSLVTEVFSLNTCWVILLLVVLRRVDETKQSALNFLFFFLWGLGLGNHHVLVFMFPLWIFVQWPQIRSGQFIRLSTVGLGAVFIFGLSIYAFLPLRAAHEPPLNWGQPKTMDRLVHVMLRKDYGTFKLTTGEAQKRTWANSYQQVSFFARQISKELPWPLLILGGFGFLIGIWQRNLFVMGTIGVFLLCGPGFIWLSNLPLNSQTEGIMGRFFIMPVVMLLLGLATLSQHTFQTFPKSPGGIKVGLGILVVFLFLTGRSEAWAHRTDFLVWDYGQNMLRTLPTNAILFMDGGDDAFYSLALLHEGMNQRPDVELHDRGGLVFRNPYGADFRRLSPQEKKVRRFDVESRAYEQRPLFYSSMDAQVFPRAIIRPAAYLVEAVGPFSSKEAFHSDLLVKRSLFPLSVHNYRTRALACFFPYSAARQQFLAGNIDKSFSLMRQAQHIGYDVDWMVNNLGTDLAQWGYQMLTAGQLGRAEKIYKQWIVLQPQAEQPQSNLGVVYERQNKEAEAEAQYKKAAQLFPSAADPVYNLAVLAWKRQDWALVKTYLEETLRRKPDHASAGQYLQQVRLRMKS